MSQRITELESILQQLIGEHRKLLGYLERQQAAMKKCDLKLIDELTNLQEGCRLRLSSLEQRRRAVVNDIAKALKVTEELTLRKLAALHPPRSAALLKLRSDLKDAVEQVRTRAYIAGRVANAVLGHLNTVVRLVAGAVEKAGLYNRRGVPRVANRIGIMDAVG